MNVPARRPKTTLGTQSPTKARTPTRRPAVVTKTRKNPATTREPAQLDPSAAWIVAHPKEVAKYRGELLAVHPRLGIVAHGADIGVVMAKLDVLRLTEREREAILLSPALG